MRLGDKKYAMDPREKELKTLGGDEGWWTTITTTRNFYLAQKVLNNEIKHNSWERVVIIGNTVNLNTSKVTFNVYGLNKPFVYPRIIEYKGYD